MAEGGGEDYPDALDHWTAIVPVGVLRKQTVTIKFETDRSGNSVVAYASVCGPCSPENAMALLKYNTQMIDGALAETRKAVDVADILPATVGGEPHPSLVLTVVDTHAEVEKKHVFEHDGVTLLDDIDGRAVAAVGMIDCCVATGGGCPADCADGEYRSFERYHATLRFDPLFLSRLSGYGSLRFMDWARTNDTTARTWARARSHTCT